MEWSMLTVWIIVIAVAIVVDIMTSTMVFVWFALGALGSIIAYTFGANIMVQIIVFCVLSIIGLILGYPFAKKILKRSVKVTKTMEENYIGKKFVAEHDIKDNGQVKINGSYWTVINNGSTIKKGEEYEILGIKGTKLIISALEIINNK